MRVTPLSYSESFVYGYCYWSGQMRKKMRQAKRKTNIYFMRTIELNTLLYSLRLFAKSSSQMKFCETLWTVCGCFFFLLRLFIEKLGLFVWHRIINITIDAVDTVVSTTYFVSRLDFCCGVVNVQSKAANIFEMAEEHFSKWLENYCHVHKDMSQFRNQHKFVFISSCVFVNNINSRK